MTAAATVAPVARGHRPLGRSAFLLGFAFSGFFDGIVLHQVLQWHHLLSGLQGAWFADLRHQVLADGAFHAVMYLVAAVGLVQLVRNRGALSSAGAGRCVLVAWLLGFAAWHGLDAVLSHWLLGLHRIRMDTAQPLAWDLGWLALFGGVPLAAALSLRRHPGIGGGRATAACMPLLVAATALAGWGALGPASGSSLVVMSPGASGAQVFRALAATDARIVGHDASGSVWLVRLASRSDAVRLYAHGAWYVSGAYSPAGCAAWFRVAS